MAYWLLKSEPESFSIDDLKRKPARTDAWDGVRNYQARNFLRDMQRGDLGFFYHSSCAVPGIVGTVQVVKTAYPDKTAFDPQSPYYDPESTPERPRWSCVDVQWVSTFENIMTLKSLKQIPALQTMALLQKGNRLSVMPVTMEAWAVISQLEN
jgi:predicted RNA-binding protein with PUA-like domain